MSPNVGQDDGSDSDLGELVLIDDVFKARAKDKVQRPSIAFPKSERGAGDFEFFTGQDLDRIIEHAARYYTNARLTVVSEASPLCFGLTLRVDLGWITERQSSGSRAGAH